MVRLYLDSSQDLITGLTGPDFDWPSYEHGKDQKQSHHIHRKIHQLLEQNDLTINDIGEVIQSSGPGSYTGIRIVEGLTQILEWQGINVCNFYHFEVPGLLGVQKGIWFSKAFKNEVFFYQWDGGKSSLQLMPEADFKACKHTEPLFTHFASPYGKATLTSEMIFENPGELFSQVSKRKMRLKPWYYRTPDQEFPPPRPFSP